MHFNFVPTSVCSYRCLFTSAALPFHKTKVPCRSICSLAPTVLHTTMETSKAAGLQEGQPNFSDDPGSHRRIPSQLHVQCDRAECGG